MSGDFKNSLIDGVRSLNPILLLIAFILFSIYVNDVIIKFRLNEFEKALTELSNHEFNNNSVNLLSRFQLIKKRQESQGQDKEEIVEEIKFQSYREGEVSEQGKLEYSMSEKMVLPLVKGVRYLMGKKERASVAVSKYDKLIEMASYYERIRQYEKALKIYDEILSHDDISPTLRSNVLVHRGFCEGLLGRYKQAQVSLQSVIENPENFGTGNWRVSKRLNTAISDLEMKTQVLLENNMDDLTRGKELFFVGNSNNASKYLKEYIHSEDISELARSEGRYYLGRAEEDRGNTEIAVNEYRKIIQNLPQSVWAKKANRRLYVLGKFYNQDEQLTQIAVANSKVYNDSEFVQNLESTFEVAEQLRKEQKENKESIGLMALIDSSTVSEVDSSGELEELEAVTKYKELSDMLGDLTVSDTLAYTGDSIDQTKIELDLALEDSIEIEEPEKQDGDTIIAVSSEPVRKRDIYQVITDRSPELNRVYAYWRQKGVVLEGTISIRLTIGISGRVEEAKITEHIGKINHRKFDRDIINRIKKWKFRPVPANLSSATLEFPIIFKYRVPGVVGRDVKLENY